MRMINRRWKLSIAFFITLFMVLTPMTKLAGTPSEQSNEITNYEKELQEAIDQASEYMIQKDEGVISEWEAIGLVQAGKTVPASYEEELYGHVEDQITNGLNTGRIKITDTERLAMAAVAIGKDPKDILDHNLIELIYNSPDRTMGPDEADTMTFQGNNGPIFALIALDTLDFDVPQDARWTRQQLVEQLLENQNDDGSWSLNETLPDPSIDITAMAIIGLSPYKDQSFVNDALDNAVTFLSNEQTDNGGFDGGDFVGGITSEAASQVIIGLTAYGIDPTSEKFTENDINLIDHLLSYQYEDGGFKHTQEDGMSNAMGTEQALQGLVAYERFLNGDGHLYNFGTSNEAPPENDDEEGSDDNNDDSEDNEEDPGNGDDQEESDDNEKDSGTGDGNEDSDKGKGSGKEPAEREVSTDKEVTASKSETITVKGSQSKIDMPDNLPKDTKLNINTVDEESLDKENLLIAGDMFNFDLELPSESEDFKGAFQLTLGVDESIDINQANIYYFNEVDQKWERIEGTRDPKNHTITAEVSHFSKYAVLMENDEQDDEEEPKENNPEKKPKKDNDDGDKLGKNELDSDKKLPETATNTFNFLLIGILLLIAGGITFLVLKRRATKIKKS